MHILKLIKNATKEEARYKTNLLGSVLALVTLYSLQFIFFDVISAFVVTDEINTNWLLIFFMSYALGGLIIGFFSSAIAGFFRHLTQGRIDVLLVRPVNLFVLILFRWCQVHYLWSALLLIIVCGLSNKIDFSPFLADILNIGLYLLIMLTGVVASIVFILALNSFSFITQRDLPVDYIHSSIFTFALLPSAFYSKILLYFLVAALPMIVFASVALDALFNGLTLFVLVYLMVVTLTFFITVRKVQSLFRRFDSIGG
ncbi:ABC-2 family transporter protein [Pseudomonas beijingensis]|uniref:ABC-2 family transporter protein n=1 Tax=Pseudomonas beijingensis TaxID=2954101 RepID=UPI002733B71F|nr:ABC-2 family transporter protein [Pseudomonas sp. FP2262]WLH46746.1 ABC-2 family transporter protein [Pseudomonas sp. FP2262]